MAERRNGIETRKRILSVACEIFAEKGFKGATHAEICRRSKANIAAINYHFRSKEELYVAAFMDAFERSLEKHPADGGVPADAAPEKRLKGRISALINRVADPENRVFDMFHNGQGAGGSSLLQKPMDELISSIRKGMREVVEKLLGPNARERDVNLCLVSVMAQCLYPAMRRRRCQKGVTDSRAAFWSKFPPDELSASVFEFSMAAIKGIRERVEFNVSSNARKAHVK